MTAPKPGVVLLATAILAGSAHSGELTSREQRGRKIYLRGVTSSGKPVAAVLEGSDAQLPGAALACAGCHGADGHGKPEGGVTPSDIRWDVLTRPYSASQAGRVHPPYDDRLLVRAITMGIDPGGNALDPAMPRFQFHLEDMDDLIAWLKRLGVVPDIGVSSGAIVIGTVLPAETAFPGRGKAIRSALNAFFGEVNRAGGVYGRKLELRAMELPGQPDRALAEIRRFLAENEIFAFVSPFIAGLEKEVSSAWNEEGVPVVGPLTLYPQFSAAANKYVFYLDSGVVGQCEKLIAYAARRYGPKSRLALAYVRDEFTSDAVKIVRERCAELGWKIAIETDIPSGQFNSAIVVSKLRTSADVLFLLLPETVLQSFLNEVQRTGWHPVLLAPGWLTSPASQQLLARTGSKAYLAFSELPEDYSSLALQDYAGLAKAYDLPRQHLPTQFAALAAARVLVRALTDSGRDLDRDKAVEAIERLYAFPTGFTPPVSFSAARRAGSLSAHIVTPDLAGKLQAVETIP